MTDARPVPSIAMGAMLMIAMRWTDRLIGFVSTLILARLLMADDFGIIAMASLVVGLIDTLFDAGAHVAIIQHKSPTKAHYDTAWTVRLGQAVISAAIVAGAAPFAADYFNDPRVVTVLWIMAAGLLLAGLENIGIVDFQRTMAFDRDFRLTVTKRLIAFFTTMALAFAWGDYWAMVVGTLVFRLSGLVLSYAMHPLRPRLSLAARADIFAVSQWMIIRSVAVYLNGAIHRLAVGRIATAGVMGGYTLADEISSMPSSELLSPINRVLLPAFSRAADDDELARLYLLSQSLQTAIGLPAGVGLSLIAADAIPVLLGSQWLFAIPFVQWLAITNAVLAVHFSGAYVLLAKGAFRDATIINWAQVIAFVVALVPFWTVLTPMLIAKLHLGVALFGLVITLADVRRVLPQVRWTALAGSTIRPLLACLAMAALLTTIAVPAWPPLLVLALKVAVGGAAYAGTLAGLWLLAGRPAGAERWVLDKAAPMVQRLARRAT